MWAKASISLRSRPRLPPQAPNAGEAQPVRDLSGLKGRGRLAKGVPADVAIFDPARIGSTNHGERRYDLPGGAKRIVMPSKGVEYTLVNGAVTWEQGKLTEAKAGQVLRG